MTDEIQRINFCWLLMSAPVGKKLFFRAFPCVFQQFVLSLQARSINPKQLSEWKQH